MIDSDSSNTAPDSSASSDDGPRSDGEPPPTDSSRHSRCQVDIQNPCHYREVGIRQLRPFVERLISNLAPEARSLALRFVSDREMRRLNGEFRQKDKPTDVLSFPGDLADVTSAHDTRDGGAAEEVGGLFEGGHLGDIAISIPTARRQAEERGESIGRELRVLTLHGILHCLGYDHEQDDGEMERLEGVLREKFIGSPESMGEASHGD